MGASKDDAQTTRQRLLEAALQVLREEGSGKLTLDQIARTAGVSKGGLLHHFPSKDALYEALISDMLRDFEERVAHFYAAEPDTAGRLMRAYIRATFAETSSELPLPLEVGTHLLATMVGQPHLRALIAADTLAWQERLLNDGLPAGRVLVIRQATDGYWTERWLGIVNDPTTHNALIEELLALTTGETPDAE
ncbi:MAG: TetR/AcrR family transcriptional regulator [Oscillochloris sp.]|nr:TetR/AcrR family transcriptional regulator [Oscillochloris sp.]